MESPKSLAALLLLSHGLLPCHPSTLQLPRLLLFPHFSQLCSLVMSEMLLIILTGSALNSSEKCFLIECEVIWSRACRRSISSSLQQIKWYSFSHLHFQLGFLACRVATWPTFRSPKPSKRDKPSKRASQWWFPDVAISDKSTFLSHSTNQSVSRANFKCHSQICRSVSHAGRCTTYLLPWSPMR